MITILAILSFDSLSCFFPPLSKYIGLGPLFFFFYFDTYNSKSINDESIQIKDIIENDKILETAKAHNDYNSIEEGQYLYFIKSTNPTRDVSYINDNQSVKKEKETIFFTKKIKKRREVLNQYIWIEEGRSMIKNQKIISSKKSLEIV